MKKRLIVSIALILILITTVVPVVNAQDDNPPTSDVFLNGNNIDVDEPIAGDLYVAGNYVNVYSDVAGDLLVGGNMVTIESTVGQNIRAGGNFVTFNNVEAQNLTIFGQSLRLNDIAVNNLYAFGQMVNFSGDAHDVYLNGYTVTIDGTIRGDSEVNANSVVITEQANILGTLAVHSNNAISYEGNVDKTNITYTKSNYDANFDFGSKDEPVQPTPTLSITRVIFKFIRNVATLFVTSLLIMLLFPKMNQIAANNLKTNTFKPVLLGLVIAAATPVLIIFTLITIIGIPLGLVATFVYVMLMIIAKSFANVTFANLAFPKQNKYLGLILTTVILVLVSYVPVLNFAVWIIIVGYTFGSLLLLFKKEIDENQKPPKQLEAAPQSED